MKASECGSLLSLTRNNSTERGARDDAELNIGSDGICTAILNVVEAVSAEPSADIVIEKRLLQWTRDGITEALTERGISSEVTDALI